LGGGVEPVTHLNTALWATTQSTYIVEPK